MARPSLTLRFLIVFKLHILVMVVSPLAGAAEPQGDGKAKYLLNMKVPFFRSVSMTCDHELLNVSSSTDVEAISWVFPDGTNVNSDADVDSKLHIFSASQAGVTAGTLDLYNLTALKIEEDQFGYYYCVVQYTSSKVAVIRWGLNVDGADFSDLLKSYRRNAVVGGVAAASVLLVIGGGCLFWNVRNNKRDEEKDEENADFDNPKAGIPGATSPREDNERKFNNAAYQDEVDDAAAVDVRM